jgi:hypothetical protein
MRLRPRAWLAALLIFFGAQPPCFAAELKLQWRRDPADPARSFVEVRGLDEIDLAAWQNGEWSAAERSKVFAVYVEPELPRPGEQLPPMLGRYRIEGGVLRFEPQFPLVAGVKYRADFLPPPKAGANRPRQTARFAVPAAEAKSTTRVAQVYPTAARIPENLLKFYVHFSAPMKRGDSYRHVHLVDDHGTAVQLPFLELDEELWNPAMTRLTLIIDPGRIKRGVRPLVEVGPALEAGKRMRLMIDADWKDAAGNPLRQTFTKVFEVAPADREPPDPARWKIIVPAAGTRAPLIVQFGKPMDQAIAQRVIALRDAAGRRLPGEAELADEEQSWRFLPADPWPAAKLEIVIPKTIEDLAGNNIGKAFDVDLFERIPQHAAADPVVKLPVEIR